MNRYHRFLPLFLLMTVFLVTFGCGQGYQGGERLYPVSITVMKDGTPFTDATVVLLRESGNTINAGGVTDANGIAKIKVDAQWNGVPVGTYKVMINKDVQVQDEMSREEYLKLELEAREAHDKKMHEKRMSMPLPVPEVLRGMKSPLTIEVTSSGDNTQSFDIGEY